jgi:chromosome partitioning protein
MRTIAVVNQKGGCGKTITSINLSAFLAREQRRVLLVDMDPQGHATLGLLTDAVRPSRTMYEVFVEEPGERSTVLRDVILTVRENLDVAPADILLSGVPEALAGQLGREDILSDALVRFRDDYDYVIVDCPPSVGLLTFNALKACSEAIVPVDPSFFALHGIGKLLETFDVLQKETGHHITVRALVTLYSGRTAFAKAVADDIRHHLYGRHFDTVIRYSVKLAEAASHGIPIAHYCKWCVGFEDYQALANEVLLQESARTEDGRVATGGDPIPMGAGFGWPELSAPDGTFREVVFAIEAPHAAQVQVMGDFNDWNLEGSEMEPVDGTWRKVVSLPPGRYRYRYIVDGRWQSDPLNVAVEPNPFGGLDSILVVDEQLAG